ncbi:Hypothetical_protein [Hexamita inflata]|uniref:Hypothetical_protein n=1 Tax=Hexamita inflata TaxID=28002 RepID=A0AA86Q820_9EUKA|nr:Hypothetical protein HINF_LOCUS38787 [Hexamita inflata]
MTYMNFSSYMLSGPLTFSGYDQRDYYVKRESYPEKVPHNKTVPSQTNQNATVSKAKTDENVQKPVQKQQTVAQNATNSKREQDNASNKRVEIAPQGQLITLPNGEVGLFIPLTQSQQRQVYIVQAQQAPQFSQSQPPQYYQPIQQYFVQQVPIYQHSQVCQVLEMPQMPNMM